MYIASNIPALKTTHASQSLHHLLRLYFFVKYSVPLTLFLISLVSRHLIPIFNVSRMPNVLAVILCTVIATDTWANLLVSAADIETSKDYNAHLSTRSCKPGQAKEFHQVVNASGEIWPYQVYKSSPCTPPVLQITENGQPLAPGFLFITPSSLTAVQATEEFAPLIMTDAGQLVWNGPMTRANNFRVASYKGNRILTYWSGTSSQAANVGHAYGNITFLDPSYNEILNVCPQFGLVTPGNVVYPCQADLHESTITNRNTLLVTAYNATPADLSSIGGPSSGWVFDCLFFQLDPKSGAILFHWSALEHVPINETHLPFTGTSGLNQSFPFDYFHINSVVEIGNHHFLANSRHTWSTYMIKPSGDVAWTVKGDTGGDFGTLPPNGNFVSIPVSCISSFPPLFKFDAFC